MLAYDKIMVFRWVILTEYFPTRPLWMVMVWRCESGRGNLVLAVGWSASFPRSVCACACATCWQARTGIGDVGTLQIALGPGSARVIYM